MGITHKLTTIVLTIISVLFIASCSSTGTLYYKDGKSANTVICNGTSWMDCYKDAGDVCKTSGYAILEKHSNKEMGFWGPEYHKEMIFTCNEVPIPPR
jgi:hypothetical protein